jgi:hypothetical protein
MSRLGTVWAAAAMIVLAQAGCERHTASETVPGYAEKLAAKNAAEKKDAATSEPVNPAPPKFFPKSE